ncbi:MAG: MBL fold metallo-hydrolase [Chloroflexi bacterium]|nr:MBL fold metallo-hydrolase [Chloroflexota bacterium]
MNVQLISTGYVKITQNFRVGKGTGAMRLINALSDRRFSEWLPIYCTVIEHPEGLIVVDTGIPATANDPVWFPPHVRLLQAVAPFQITPEQEIGAQMQARGLDPRDVRWVIHTHLHQDHDGGMAWFPNAEFLIGREEWAAGIGFKGRMNGYFNWRWSDLSPRLVDFTSGAYERFEGSEAVTRAGDVRLVPTPGHSKGHLSVVIEQGDHIIFVAGDAAYTQDLLLSDTIDGVGPSPEQQHDTHRRILELAARTPMIFLPSHDPEGEARLQRRSFVPMERVFA